jgi:hypothetical protein
MRFLPLVLSFFLLAGAPAGAEEPLRNEDIAKLVAAGLGDELVVAKIREASAIAFALDVDDLVALKQGGVSEKIVQAMLERKSKESAGTKEANPAAPWAAPEAYGALTVKVAIESREGVVAIPILRGELSSPGFAGFGATYINYPGLRAPIRTKDRRPSLLVKASAPLPPGRYFLAKLDLDEDDLVRSLKIAVMKAGFKAVFGGGRATLAPDSDWTVAFDSVEESPGVSRITLKKDLDPGEYGWYIDPGMGFQAAGLFGFGVD